MSDPETPDAAAVPPPPETPAPAGGPAPDPSREMRRSRAIRRFRWLVLVATVAAVALVVVLFLVGRSDRPGSGDDPDDLESASMEPTGEMVTVGEGFERTVTEGDRQLFTVRGDRYAVNREGTVFLEGVEVMIEREEGGAYRVKGEQARFEMEERRGRLAGGVRVEAPDGLVLETESLRVTDEGTQIRTSAPVSFELGEDYTGTAEGLRAWLKSRRFLLEGLVEIESRPGAEEPLRIQAKGLVLDRNRKLLRSQDWAVLRRRGERLSALEMHFFFADDERTLRFVRAERKVSGLLRSGGSVDLGDSGARRLGFEAGKMTLLMSDDGRTPRQLDLERVGRRHPRIYTLGPPAAPRYRLSAPAITAWFGAGGAAERAVAEGRAPGDVVLVMHEPGERVVDEAALGAQPAPEEAGDAADAESAPEEDAERAGPTRRRATARIAEAAFGADGEVATIVMRDGVTLEDGEIEAEGEVATFRVAEERAELEGRPAVARGDQGVMEAPRILYTRDTGIVHGVGGVRARIDDAEDSPLGGSPLAGGPRGGGPVRIEAEQGFLRDEPRTFLFVGAVRAWRGDDLLVADELRGDEAEDRLTATGGVRTLWNPEEDDGAPAGSAQGGPIEVTSNELVYRQGERVLVYTGDVKAVQGGREIASQEMVLTLAEGGGLERLVATGDVTIDAPPRADAPGETGKSLRGARAVYDPGARTIDVSAAAGGKVSLRDSDGSVVQGPRMVYDIEADRVRVVGREPGAP